MKNFNDIKVLLFILIFSMSSFITACSEKNSIESIIGKWHNEETNESWEFSDDGKWVLFDEDEVFMTGTFEYIDESTIRLHHESITTIQGVVRVVLSGNRLRLTVLFIGDGASAWYTRVQ